LFSPPVDSRKPGDDEEGAINPGSNLFVTGIHPRLTESDICRLFEKYGDVENCSIMLDPHTKESRGFGFVKMVTAEQADAAKEGLQGEVIEGRTLSIEKARRSRPRTPTPGKYFGPPKRGKSSYTVVQGYNSTADTFLPQTSVDLVVVAAAAVVTVTMTDADLTVAAGVAAAAVVVTITVMVVMTPTVIVVTMVVAVKAAKAAKAANTATILVVSTVTTIATVVALIATPPVVVVAVKSGTVASLAVTIVVAIMIVMLTLPATATPLLPVNPTLAALMNPVVAKTDTVAGR
jgi:hypothetical protein